MKIKSKSIDDSYFIEVCYQSKSMASAAATLGIHFNSFKKKAIVLGCYNPNQAGIGVRKNSPKIPIEDIIFHNLYPHYQTYKLKVRLFNEKIKQKKCEECGIIDWNGKSLEMELHHIDGVRTNHLLKNLMIICPNCHSQTETFRAKNIKLSA